MDSGDDSKSFVNGFDFVLNCLELAFCWRNRYHIFVWYIRTEFLFYFVLSFLSVALLVFSRSLYNNHDNRIGLSEALIFNPFRISRAVL
jgi:hypothetical protein